MLSQHRAQTSACPKTGENRVDCDVPSELKLELSVQVISALDRSIKGGQSEVISAPYGLQYRCSHLCVDVGGRPHSHIVEAHLGFGQLPQPRLGHGPATKGEHIFWLLPQHSCVQRKLCLVPALPSLGPCEAQLGVRVPRMSIQNPSLVPCRQPVVARIVGRLCNDSPALSVFGLGIQPLVCLQHHGVVGHHHL